jgi:hypothetical protein
VLPGCPFLEALLLDLIIVRRNFVQAIAVFYSLANWHKERKENKI